MVFSVAVCLFSFICLVIMLRRDRVSMGIPLAYLFILHFLHVPGAVSHILGAKHLADTDATAIGIWLTAIASVCFVAGTWLARRFCRGVVRSTDYVRDEKFALFCFVVGLLVLYGLRFAFRSPSIGAVLEKGSGIWVLGCLVGLNAAFRESSLTRVLAWLGAMSIYPILTLLLGGFLSFGSTPTFVILASLAVTARNHRTVALAIPVVTFAFFLMFISYFQSRTLIREAVWGGADMEARVERAMLIITNMELFDPTNESHLIALDQRLNQNFFVGKAAQRLEAGSVDWLYGRSFWEGIIAVVPRVVWPSKPVFAGSPKIVMEMTGFKVNENTAYGVGNVMELYINFGMYSLIPGFILLGALLGWLDKKGAIALCNGETGRALLFFMPAAAMIHPIGSLVELTGGGACAFLAALGWRAWWDNFSSSRVRHPNALHQNRY